MVGDELGGVSKISIARVWPEKFKLVRNRCTVADRQSLGWPRRRILAQEKFWGRAPAVASPRGQVPEFRIEFAILGSWEGTTLIRGG